MCPNLGLSLRAVIARGGNKNVGCLRWRMFLSNLHVFHLLHWRVWARSTKAAWDIQCSGGLAVEAVFWLAIRYKDETGEAREALKKGKFSHGVDSQEDHWINCDGQCSARHNIGRHGFDRYKIAHETLFDMDQGTVQLSTWVIAYWRILMCEY